jgi:hypothetical protein
VKLMNKSRKGFMTLTLLTIASIALVVVAYAVVTIGTFQGGNVTVTRLTGAGVSYSPNESTWTSTLDAGMNAWYSKVSIDTYTGPVTVTWQLQQNTGTWVGVGDPTTTTITLTGGANQLVYATANGQASGNRDWSQDATTTGTYRVLVTVAST